jgi:cytidine deaminase
MTTIDWEMLRAEATEVAQRAYAPYSKLHVGAAGLTADGRLVRGCNVENASYGLTLCAECGLVSDLHATGGGRLVAVVCVDGAGNRLAPCGRCRQLLYEAGGRELLVDEQPILDLLPGAFGPDDLPA